MRFVFRVLYDAIMRFSQDDGWAIASHIALSILTSLFPFLIFVTALAGFFGSTSLADEVHELAHILLQTWPQQVAAPIGNEIHNGLTQTRSGLLTISVILAIYFSSSGVEAVRIGLNRAYDIRDSRSWWLLRLESIAYIFVGAFALLTLGCTSRLTSDKTFQPRALVLTFRRTSLCESREQSLEVSWHFAQALQC